MVAATAKVVLISAIASGQGKTTTTAALARKLVQQGKTVRIFKTGPDFIDPMMLEHACGYPVYSLDLWMVGQTASQHMLAQAAQQADVILIEGVMGLYDGNPSSADLARAFGVPVLAVLDASAMAQTVGALALGLRDFGPVHLAGVIANRVASAGHAQMVAEAMRDIPLLGSLTRQESALPERHLGLVLPEEIQQLDVILDQMAENLTLDMQVWDALPETQFEIDATVGAKTTALFMPLKGKTIAIARDAAFAFLYPANLQCLRDLGADLMFFSPIANQAVPDCADAIYLPGGYPELHAQELAQADQWMSSIRTACVKGVPIWAECGGMMAITDAVTDQAGITWPMAGLLPGKVVMQKRLAALGGQVLNDKPLRKNHVMNLRGHTFHYSRFDTDLQPVTHTSKQRDGTVGEAIYQIGNVCASYFHAYFPSDPTATAGLFLSE